MKPIRLLSAAEQVAGRLREEIVASVLRGEMSAIHLLAAAEEHEHAYATEEGGGGFGDGGEDDFIETNSARIAAVGDELKSDIP
jgi:hypothetical protein